VTLSRGDGAPAHDRLLRGERPSVKDPENGAEHVLDWLTQELLDEVV
jgi:hypothetical protein